MVVELCLVLGGKGGSGHFLLVFGGLISVALCRLGCLWGAVIVVVPQ